MKKFIACYRPNNYRKPCLFRPVWAKNKAEAMNTAEGRVERGYQLSWMLPEKDFRKSFRKI